MSEYRLKGEIPSFHYEPWGFPMEYHIYADRNWVPRGIARFMFPRWEWVKARRAEWAWRLRRAGAALRDDEDYR